MENKILELETRRQIYNFITKYPGLHIREISRKTNIPFTTLRHHLIYLEKHDLIIRKKEGKYNRFYAKNKIDHRERKIIDFLRQDTSRNIILLLLAYVECSQIELSQNLGKHPSTILYYLKKMQDMGIVECSSITNGITFNRSIPLLIERKKITNETIYTLQNPSLIYNILIQYKNNLFDDAKIKFVLDYIEGFISEGVPKKILSPKSSVDSIKKLIFEDLFPPPFCA